MFYKPGDYKKRLKLRESRGFGHLGNIPTPRSRSQNVLPKAARNQQQSEASRAYTAIVDVFGDANADFTSIQKAVDDVGSRGGGTILIKEGTYIVDTTIEIDNDGITLVGESRDETIIKMGGNANLQPMIQVTANDFSISDMTLDGNKANQTEECSLLWWEDKGGEDYENCTVQRVTFKNSNSLTLDTTGDNAALHFENNDNYSIDGCYFLNCGSWAIFARFSFYGSIRSSLAENCGAGFRLSGETLAIDCAVEGTHSSGDGFEFDTQSAAIGCFANGCSGVGFDVSSADTQISIVGCLAKDCSVVGFDIDGEGSIVVGCYTFSNGDAGISVDGKYNTASGNVCWGEDEQAIEVNGEYNTITNNVCIKTDTGSNSVSAIALGPNIGADAKKNIVANNVTVQGGSTNLWNYGIFEHSGSDNNLIHGNLLDGYNTGGISTSGASTTTADNKVI